MRRWQFMLLGGLALALLGARPAPPATVTFFVASDSHFGAARMDEWNRTLVEQMNALPGTAYPPELGGAVEDPRGLLFTGDATENGELGEFGRFESLYGLTGRDGLLRFPTFEAIGNHDVNSVSPVKERVRARHGGINYSWSWEGVRFACLDMYPDAGTLAWLQQDLHPLPRRTPLVLFFHYSLEGPYSEYWERSEKEAFAQAIAKRNVLALFHGHEHHVGHYRWRGHPVFRPGSPKHSSRAFLVARLGAAELSVAAWDFEARRWAGSWSVPVRRP